MAIISIADCCFFVATAVSISQPNSYLQHDTLRVSAAENAGTMAAAEATVVAAMDSTLVTVTTTAVTTATANGNSDGDGDSGNGECGKDDSNSGGSNSNSNRKQQQSTKSCSGISGNGSQCRPCLNPSVALLEQEEGSGHAAVLVEWWQGIGGGEG